MLKDTEELEIVKGNGETILVIEDEEMLVEVTKISLEMNGYSVISAANGIEGINKFSELQESISAVVCDINMPHLDGISALQSILSLKPDVKIIVVSGSIETDLNPELLKLPSAIFLQKPYRAEKLILALQKLFKNEHSSASS